MPTYDYICDDCGHEFEAFEPITSKPQTDCPTCKEPKLRRKIGPGAAILFKGSGFYQTDYRSDSYKKAAKAEKSSTDASGGAKGDSGGAKSESSGSGSSSSTATASTSTPSGSKSSSNGTS
jgi:putative FmdB family regulatory protein